MTLNEIKLLRLYNQHLLHPTDTQTVVKDLCGVQAQYLAHALHGLSIRCEQVDTENLVKSWTNRGTLHLFSQDDLPLFLHQGRNYPLRPVDTMGSDAYLDATQKAYFADSILDAVASGIETREALREVCRAKVMTDLEAESIFNPWGGLLRALCENGKLCHRVQEPKAFRLCPSFEPMDIASAQKELLRRYFTHFGPATIKDASYFFAIPQKQVKAFLRDLPVSSFQKDNRTFYHIGEKLPDTDIPKCLFLSGFDQLLLGYEKTESIFLPNEHIRDIFTLAGIVRPAILVNGTVSGYWNNKNGKLSITLFNPNHRNLVYSSAVALWPNIKQITIA